jgi:hypothetical protein
MYNEGAMDPDKRQALSDFYREEFARHLELLESNGVLGVCNPGGIRVCRKLVTELDHVCWSSHFPAVAETLLRNFDALTHLSELDLRQRH